MSTASAAPILPAALAPLAASPVHDSGADTAPGVIGIDACTTLGTTLVVHVSGEIDRLSSAPLGALMASAAEDGYIGLVLDASQVTFCDSGFLRVLRWWPRDGRRLRLTNPSRAVQHLLRAVAVTARNPARARPFAGGITALSTLPG
ncbi:STAS domain-containing protein [Streptomyces sp. NPDC090127]|uniref:STAS domain-containing protein n=1 Tax=Streptomyces sp. NPDC090127 TaxID=3365953 RepID=UPI00380EC942